MMNSKVSKALQKCRLIHLCHYSKGDKKKKRTRKEQPASISPKPDGKKPTVGSMFSMHHSHQSPTPSTKNGVYRCPFSGIAVDESIFQDFESQMQRHRSHTQLDNLNSADHQSFRSVTSSHERSTAGRSATSTQHEQWSTTGGDRIYNYQHQRRPSSSSSAGQPALPPAPPLTPTQRQPHPPHPPLASIFQESDNVNSTATIESDNCSIRSNEDSNRSGLSKTTMRIRISNAVSNRSKDLVVDIKSDVFLYDSVYEHQAVKSAHVRKWGPDVVKDVKKNTAEIKCEVLDGIDGDVCRTFTVDDLKATSTKELFEIVPSSDPAILVLKCVRKKSLLPNVQKRSVVSNPKFSLVFEKGQPLALTSPKKTLSALTTSSSAPCFAGGLKRSSRPNHMNLSAMRNAAFTVPLKADTASWSNASEHSSSLNGSVASLDGLKRRRRRRTSVSYLNPLDELKKETPIKIVNERNPLGNGNLAESDAPGKSSLTELSSAQAFGSNDSLDPILLLEKYSQAPEMRSMNESSFDECDSKNNESLEDSKHVRFKKRSSGGSEQPTDAGHEQQIKEFMRLCRSKKAPEHQSSDNLRRRKLRSVPFTATNGAQNASFYPVASSEAPPPVSQNNGLRGSASLQNIYESLRQSKKTPGNNESDRISRFLQYSASRANISGESGNGLPTLSGPAENSSSKVRAEDGDDDQSAMVSLNKPPIAEIAVIKGSSSLDAPAVPAPSISLSGNVVKEVFPYHIVFDEEFNIQQVGNSLSLLIDGCQLLGRCISDIFQITGPIPSFGKWEWKTLDKMKDNTVFLESVNFNSSNQKAKVKGTIIDLSVQPRQIMLALFPNVKNLSELEDMNLSMADLPLHSCQREAVLLGEHSKSEVKLTNHLDQLHRELINSMEKQIEERTDELATANRDLAEANDLLARQSARQLEHFACMSHEIRTPLSKFYGRFYVPNDCPIFAFSHIFAASFRFDLSMLSNLTDCIVGMSSLLLEDTEDLNIDPMHADSIRMINTSGELLKAVVDDVLDYAKLESGSFLVDIKPTRLQDTLDSVVHSISQKVQEKNIRLRTHYSPTLPEILETDSRRLQQVLFNLLGNAGKFSTVDSVIDLSVTLIHPDEKAHRGDIIRFSVKDYGKGIESKDFETIFQPFSQASKETQNVYGGTGLGLSITSKLVKRLGGSISVNSEYGKYAEFTVDLPMNGVQVDVKGISSRLKKATIVIVERERKYDYSFSEYSIEEEPLPLSPAVAGVYDLNVLRFSSLEDAYSTLSTSKDTSKQMHFGLLVHEELYSNSFDEQMMSLFGQQNYTLMTHGPNYAIPSTKDRHFKSLSGMFPASLLNSIAKHIELTERMSSTPPSFAATGLFAALNKSSATEMSVDTLAMKNQKRTNGELVSPKSPKKFPAKYDLKVLYAEDNVVNQKVLSRVLNRTGITDITIVDNGKKAVDVSADTKFDCIFMDMQMPVMVRFFMEDPNQLL